MDDLALAAIVADAEAARAFARRWTPPAIVTDTLADCDGDPREDCRRLVALLTDTAWLQPMLAEPLAMIAAAPLAPPPFRASAAADGRMGLRLARTAHVTLTLSVQPPVPDPPQLLASGRTSVMRMLAGGGARLQCWACGDIARLVHHVVASIATPLVVDGARQAIRLVGQRSVAVSLVAALTPSPGAIARRYSADDGRLVARHDAGETGARMRLLLALLATEGAPEHRATFAALSCDPDPQVRWAAMRGWLGQDARAAANRLATMAAADPDPAVRAAAVATLAVLTPRLAA